MLWPRVTSEELQLVMGFSSQVVIGRLRICCGRLAEHMELWQVGIVSGRQSRLANVVAFRQSRLANVVAGQHCGRLAEHTGQQSIYGREGRIMTGWPSIHLDRQAGLCCGREGSIVAGREGRIVAGREGSIVAGREGRIVAGREGSIVAGRDQWLLSSWQTKTPDYENLISPGALMLENHELVYTSQSQP